MDSGISIHHSVIQMRLVKLSVLLSVRSGRIVEMPRPIGGGGRQRRGRSIGPVRRRSSRSRKRPSGINRRRRNDLFAAEFSLGSEALQVGHETHPQRILNVHSFDGDHVTCHFRCALPEAHRVVIHRVFMRIVSQ